MFQLDFAREWLRLAICAVCGERWGCPHPRWRRSWKITEVTEADDVSLLVPVGEIKRALFQFFDTHTQIYIYIYIYIHIDRY